MIVAGNLHLADWTQVFSGKRSTAALLDRLTRKAHILALVAESYKSPQPVRWEASEENEMCAERGAMGRMT